ncbi:MAG: ORF6N domain-containing protein, partial [Thermoguttaceae bacterium]|nr:ORF6N domain-containing protein [Thermoguttaceae bacterium]
QSVSRNKDKFPDDFCFQLTMKEYNNILKSQIGTSSLKKHGGVRKLPFAFTEEGVAMLATTIHTKVANEMSIRPGNSPTLLSRASAAGLTPWGSSPDSLTTPSISTASNPSEEAKSSATTPQVSRTAKKASCTASTALCSKTKTASPPPSIQ